MPKARACLRGKQRSRGKSGNTPPGCRSTWGVAIGMQVPSESEVAVASEHEALLTLFTSLPRPARSVSPTRRTRRMTAGARILELFSYIALKIPIRLRKYQPSSSRDGHRPSPSKPPLPSRKPNLAWRLFKLACIVFSLLYFTLDTAKGINSISRRSNVLRQEDLDIIDSSLPLLKLDKPLNPGWSGSAKKKLHTVYSGAASVLRGSRVNGNNPADAVEDAVPRPIQQTFDGIPDVGRRFSDGKRTWPRSGGILKAAGSRTECADPFPSPCLLVDGAQETGFIKSSLSALSNSYRFSKLFSTVDSGLHGNIEPFAFNAEEPGPKKGVTACLYYNEAWLSLLPEFMKRWHGLASVVVEVLGNEDSTSARRVHEAIEDLRASDEDITYLVDFHIVYTPLPATSSIADRARDRMLTKPTSSNFHLNLARFFARTDLVWLVGDSRIVPPHDLRRKLDNMPIVRTIALDKADAIVIPTFGLTRDVPSQSTQYHFPDLDEMREGQASGLGSDEIVEEEGEAYRSLAQDYVRSVLASLPIPLSHWPNRKDPLAGLAANRPPGSLIPAHLAAHQGPLFYLSDVGWDKGKGPTNFQEWRKHRRSPPSSSGDGGAGVQQDGQEAQEEQEDAFYLLRDHDPQYSPSLLIGKDRQPWCPERFEHNRAACAYQMFIAGSNMHVMSDGWAYTFADVDDAYGDQDSDEADRLKVGPGVSGCKRSTLSAQSSSDADVCLRFPRRSLLTPDPTGYRHNASLHQIPLRGVHTLRPQLCFDWLVGDRTSGQPSKSLCEDPLDVRYRSPRGLTIE